MREPREGDDVVFYDGLDQPHPATVLSVDDAGSRLVTLEVLHPKRTFRRYRVGFVTSPFAGCWGWSETAPT